MGKDTCSEQGFPSVTQKPSVYALSLSNQILPFKAPSINWWPDPVPSHSLHYFRKIIEEGDWDNLGLKLLKSAAAKHVIFGGLCSDIVWQNLPIYLKTPHLQLMHFLTLSKVPFSSLIVYVGYGPMSLYFSIGSKALFYI